MGSLPNIAAQQNLHQASVGSHNSGCCCVTTTNLFQNTPSLVQLIGETLVIFVVMAAMLLILGLASEDRMIAARLYQWANSLYTRQRGAFTRFITAKLP